MSQIIAMAKRLQDAEQTVADLRRALEARGPSTGLAASEASSSGESLMEAKPAVDLGRLPQVSGGMAHLLQQKVRTPPRDSAEELLSDLSLDGNGKVRLV